jgi:hypothetical protein
MANVKFNSFAKQIDGQNYCSAIESYAENIIEDNEGDAVLYFPSANTWGSMRSSSYRMTTENVSMILPKSIYKLKKAKLIPIGFPFFDDSGQFFASWQDFKDEKGNTFAVDITKYIVLRDVWQALKVPKTTESIISQSLYLSKGNSLYYEQNGRIIELLSTEYKNSLVNNMPVSFALIYAAVLSDENSKNYKAKTKFTTEAGDILIDISLYDQVKEKANGRRIDVAGHGNDVRNWLFQILYIPVPDETKIKTHKNEPTTRQYTQVVNQRAEVNRASAFGHYLHTTAQKTGTEKIAIAKTYKKIKDVPPIGALIRHKGERYRLVANSWKVTNPFTFTVTHTLSKNWTSKSKHVSVDQKYRNWSIPFDSYIWRTIYYEEFIELSGGVGIGGNSAFHETERQNALKALFSVQESNQELRNLFLFKRAQGFNGVTVPVSTFGMGNSIVFSAQMVDNLSAGVMISPTDSEYCEEAFYCYEDGTLDDCRIILSTGMDLFNADMLPASYEDTIAGTGYNRPVPTENGYVFDEKFHLDKDAGEAIRITIQAHYIPTEDWIVVGNKLAENHPFISGKAKKFNIWLLKDYIRDGSNYLDVANASRDWVIGIDTNDVLSAVVQCDGKSIKLNDELFLNGDGNWKAWAITDENRMLYIGSNDISKREIHFTWKRKRSRK